MFAAALTLAQNRKRPACPPPGRVTLTVGYNPRLEEQAGTGMVQKATRSIHRKFLKNYNREQMGGARGGGGAGHEGVWGDAELSRSWLCCWLKLIELYTPKGRFHNID